jgi:hypothetical protein
MWGNRIAKNNPLVADLDPVLLAAIISALLPLIGKICKFQNEPTKAKEKAAVLILRGEMKPPLKIRREMRRQGLKDTDKQDRVWVAMMTDAANQPDVEFEKVAASINWTED